jgi:hypothetical protein
MATARPLLSEAAAEASMRWMTRGCNGNRGGRPESLPRRDAKVVRPIPATVVAMQCVAGTGWTTLGHAGE